MQKFVLKDNKRIDCFTNFGFMHFEESKEEFDNSTNEEDYFYIDSGSLKISDNQQKIYSNPLDVSPLDHQHVFGMEPPIKVYENFQNVTVNSITEDVNQVIHEKTVDEGISCLQQFESEIRNDQSVLCDKTTMKAEMLDASQTFSNNLEDKDEPEASLIEKSDESYTEKCWADESTSSLESSTYLTLNYGLWRNLIQNGTILPPVRSSMENIKLINTCPKDSIMELFTAAHCFQGSFTELVFQIRCSHKSHDEIFEILDKYIQSESRSVYYTCRMEYCKSQPHLYKQTKTPECLLINCSDNVVRLFETIMSDNYSVRRKMACACNYSNMKKYNIQTVDTNFEMNGNSIYELQAYFDTYFSKNSK